MPDSIEIGKGQVRGFSLRFKVDTENSSPQKLAPQLIQWMNECPYRDSRACAIANDGSRGVERTVQIFPGPYFFDLHRLPLEYSWLSRESDVSPGDPQKNRKILA